MTLATVIKCKLPVMTSKALHPGAVVTNADERLLLRLKELGAGSGENPMAIVAGESLGNMALMVEDHLAFPATAVRQHPGIPASSARDAQKANQQQPQPHTEVEADHSHLVMPGFGG